MDAYHRSQYMRCGSATPHHRSNTAMTQDVVPVESRSSQGPSLPRLTREAVDACAFASWFPKFRRVSPKATIIPLGQDFIDYLKADGVFLPNDDESDSGDSDFDPNGENNDEQDDDEDEETKRPHYDFHELDERIREVIEDYEAVFPKLNWSSPQDAAWMGAGPPLKCLTPEDVYLHLKASDFITHDLQHAYDDCDEDIAISDKDSGDYHLVLKKWFNMPRSHEFRCFVRDQELFAICQRDTNYYDFMQDVSRQSKFKTMIKEFFTSKIREQFPLKDYVLDVYLTRDEDRVFLIDFNPYAVRTDALLFSWLELQSFDRSITEPALRVVTSETQASQAMPAFSHNRYPTDVVGLSDGASIAEFAQKWREALDEAVTDTLASKSVKETPNR